MLIATKLSKEFYDRFGEDIVNELVDMLNLIESTYRNELREQNEMNWARFDAKLEQRSAEVRADMQTLRAEVHGDLEKVKGDIIKWMFLFWTATAFAGFLFRALGWSTHRRQRERGRWDAPHDRLADFELIETGF